MADKPNFVYITYIQSSPERLWYALTDPELTAEYWGHSNISDWQVGSKWEHRRTDGSAIADVVGTVIVAEPPRRLVLTFDSPDEPHDPPTRVTFEIEPYEDIVRLTVIHEDIPDEANLKAVSVGWPAVMANLKSLLETGHALPQPPWEMHADLRRSQMLRRDG